MDRRSSRSVRTKNGVRGSYYAGSRFGRRASSTTQVFSTDEYYHSSQQTKSSKGDFCSISSDGSTTEEDLFSHELHGRLCKKIAGTPMNKITDQVVSRIVENRHSSPSVIAKLMGFDELPPSLVASEIKNETGHFLLNKSAAGLGEKYECFGNHSFHVRRRWHHNFKIVHDHFDSSKAKNHVDQVVQKEKQNSKPDIAFIKKQLVEARRLSTNEARKKSREFRVALDMMDANKIIFLKIVQEPNSLFAKHAHDLKHSKSSSHANRFNILESSSGKSETFYRSVKESKEHIRKVKDTTHCCTKFCSSLHSHCTYNHVDSPLPKLLRSQYIGKPETSTHPSPTSIVIPKPGNQKVQSTEGTESCPKYLQNYRLNCRGDTKFHGQFHVQRGGECHQLFGIKAKGCNMIAANDFATNISKRVKQSLKSYSEEVFAKVDKNNSSSTYVIEPSLSSEAMKGQQEQWKKTRSFGQGLVGEGLSTSDKESPKILGQLILNKKSDKRNDKKHICGSCSYPSGICSNYGCKDECDELLPGFEDHPNSSAIFVPSKPESIWQVDVSYTNSIGDSYMVKDVLNVETNDSHNSVIERRHSLLRKLKYHDNGPQLLRLCGEENKKASREVEDRQDEFWNVINVDNPVEPKPIYLQRKMNDLLHLVCNPSNPQNLDSDKYFLTNLNEFQQSAKLNDHTVIALENEIQEVASIDFPLAESTLDVRESGALISPKVAGRCSPVSVLELPSEDGKSTPQILERIGADLQRQLNFLEFETVDSGDEQSKSLILNDKASRKILKSLKKGDERDFLYLLDILSVSGIYAATQNKYSDACYSLDNPVFPDVFDKLENEYNLANFWSRSERKLLFDHVNSILAEVLAPCMDLCPWVMLKRSTSVGHGRLVDESWRRLVQQRKELSRGKPLEKVLDTRWLYLDDHVDMVGREVERMLKDDLLNELVSEFVLG